MNLDNLLKEMKEKMQSRDLSDEYLEKNGNMTRTEMGISEYGYGITTVPCEWVYDFLSDYKRVLKENEELKENNKYIIHLTDEQYNAVIENAQDDIKQKWVQKVKDKIEEIQKDKDSKYYDMFLEARDIEYMIEVLNELLKEGE